jgi:RHS repeat-associated protein
VKELGRATRHSCLPQSTAALTSTILTQVDANNRTTSSNLGAVSNNDAGTVRSDGVNTYRYDPEGRVCAVKSEPIPNTYIMVGYLYDADGIRIAKGTITSMSCDPSTNGFQLTDSTLLGPGGEELSQFNAATGWQRTNVYAAGRLLATYDTSGLHFQLDDPLGTRRMQVSSSGIPELDFQSLPFGDGLTIYADPDSIGAPADSTPLHFTGKERDAETGGANGNDYFEARYYSSTMGRFLSPDWSEKVEPVPYSKLDDPQTLNLYAYVENNPLVNVDLDGHQNCNGWCDLHGNSAAPTNAEMMSMNETAIAQRVAFTGNSYSNQTAQQQTGPPDHVVRTGKHVYKTPHHMKNGLYFEGTVYRYKVVDKKNNIVRGPMNVLENLSRTPQTRDLPKATGGDTTNGQIEDRVGYAAASPDSFPKNYLNVVDQSFIVTWNGDSTLLSTTVQQTVSSDSDGNVTGVAHTTQP